MTSDTTIVIAERLYVEKLKLRLEKRFPLVESDYEDVRDEVAVKCKILVCHKRGMELITELNEAHMKED